jgi:hypothetical protein
MCLKMRGPPGTLDAIASRIVGAGGENSGVARKEKYRPDQIPEMRPRSEA